MSGEDGYPFTEIELDDKLLVVDTEEKESAVIDEENRE